MAERYIQTATGRHVAVPQSSNTVRKNLFFPEREKQVPPEKKRRDSLVYHHPEQYDVSETEKVKKLTPEDQRTYLELYQRAQWTFRAVNEVASSIAKQPHRVTVPSETDPIRRETVPHAPLKRLLRNPNPIHTTYEFFFSTVAFLILSGNSYWFIEREGGQMDGEPIGLHLARPDRVSVTPRTDGRLQFERRVTDGRNEKKEQWTHRDVVHFTMFNPLDFSQGMPHVQPGEDSSIIDLYLKTSDKRFWKNAINPRYILEAKGDDMGEDAFERLRYELDLFHKGANEFHKVAILENAELRELTNKHHADSDVLNHRKLVRDEELGNLGAHHLVALFSGMNRSTLEMAYRLFWELTVLPIACNVQQTISKELVWQMKSPALSLEALDLDFEFDTRREMALRESEEEQSLIDFRDGQMGFRTVDEIRYDRGLGGPVPGGDVPRPTMGEFSRTRTDSNEMRSRESERNLSEQNDADTV